MGRKSFAVVLGFLAGIPVQPVLATYARVESMGKTATFFMDDISIFDNPANVSIFPNFLIGELGAMLPEADTSPQGDPAVPRFALPEGGWFGGIFSYSLGKRQGLGTVYPLVSVGGAFNRRDEEIGTLLPDSVDGQPLPRSASHLDGFAGITLKNGGMLGAHLYTAYQEGAEIENGQVVRHGPDIRLKIYRGDFGVNWPLAKNLDVEGSVGAARTAFGPASRDPEWSYFVKGRAFTTLELIHGELVPVFNFTHVAVPGRARAGLQAGVGANVALDRGFFWIGLLGLWNEARETGVTRSGEVTVLSSDSAGVKRQEESRGAAVSFGIERNIWWDWLVVRVGGLKEMSYREVRTRGERFSYLHTNPVSNATPGDHIGFGVGLNIEEKLKVDATVDESLPYTLGNLFSGPRPHLVSRISATYSF